MRNRSGPNTEQCGTPCFIINLLESYPFIDTNCCLLLRYDLNQSLASPLIS